MKTQKSWVVHDWGTERHFTFFNENQAWLFAAERAWAERSHYGEPYGVNLKYCLEKMETSIKQARNALSENKTVYLKEFFKLYDKVSDHPFTISEAEHQGK